MTWKHILAAMCLVVATGAGMISNAQARGEVAVYIGTPPPPPRVEPLPPPRSGWVWAPGYWHWNGYRHVWVRGHWVHERRGYHYVPGHWVERHGRWYFRSGHWER